MIKSEEEINIEQKISATYDTIIGLEKSISNMEEELRKIKNSKIKEE